MAATYDHLEQLILQKYGGTNISPINDTMFQFVDHEGSIVSVVTFNNLTLANLLSSFRHPTLLRVAEVSLLESGIFSCLMNRPQQLLEYYVGNSETDYNYISPENKIKWCWQLTQLMFELNERGYSLYLSPGTVWFTGHPAYPDTDIVVYDSNPHFGQYETEMVQNGRILRETIFSFFTDQFNEPTIDEMNQILPADYPRRAQLMEFFQVLQDGRIDRATIESLTLFTNLPRMPIQVLPIVGITENPNIDFLPTLIEVTAKARFNMQALFMAVDLWYRCGNLTENAGNRGKLAYTILFIVDRFMNDLMTGAYMDVARQHLYPNGSGNAYDLFFNQIASKVKFVFHRRYLYEAATSLNQVMASYIYIVPYPDIYRQVNITAWYQQIPADGTSKRVLAQSALQIGE